jgi:hypothetical protein
MIVPDDKNWTWVLERRCGECGFDAQTFPRAEIGAMTRANAAAWTAVLQRADARVRHRDDRWSALEYACHVRDVMRVYDERLRRMLVEDGPRYENWDQDETAIEDRYGEQDPGMVAGEIATLAAVLADRFDTVSGDQWERAGYRSDGAAFTIESLARYFIHDPIHHLWDVTPQPAS